LSKGIISKYPFLEGALELTPAASILALTFVYR